jgi:hypothetical protein
MSRKSASIQSPKHRTNPPVVCPWSSAPQEGHAKDLRSVSAFKCTLQLGQVSGIACKLTLEMTGGQ